MAVKYSTTLLMYIMYIMYVYIMYFMYVYIMQLILDVLHVLNRCIAAAVLGQKLAHMLITL